MKRAKQGLDAFLRIDSAKVHDDKIIRLNFQQFPPSSSSQPTIIGTDSHQRRHRYHYTFLFKAWRQLGQFGEVNAAQYNDSITIRQ